MMIIYRDVEKIKLRAFAKTKNMLYKQASQKGKRAPNIQLEKMLFFSIYKVMYIGLRVYGNEMLLYSYIVYVAKCTCRRLPTLRT